MQKEGHMAVKNIPKAVTAVTDHRIQAEVDEAGVVESEKVVGPMA